MSFTCPSPTVEARPEISTYLIESAFNDNSKFLCRASNFKCSTSTYFINPQWMKGKVKLTGICTNYTKQEETLLGI